MKQQIFALTRAAVEQRARPIDRAVLADSTLALPAVFQPSCAGFGIRPRIRSRANA
ncbi:hypothetical protein HK44_003750 [Pseudomonas fluorescens HK44]|uniref:Uncharacterized protein n=1 Tax=Pseudomonas fluorescens HK44 TaxID=1042209 RepID=A0A010T9N3_PSEFL|nr:hypothetical protein HK44_003750 [Pseudomonas fluorescens HK44]